LQAVADQHARTALSGLLMSATGEISQTEGEMKQSDFLIVGVAPPDWSWRSG
jgi:hypothetical protein